MVVLKHLRYKINNSSKYVLELVMNNNECPYCKNKRYKKLYSTNVSVTEAYDLLKCTNCSGIRLSPMPSDERQKTAYDLVYYGSGKKKFPGLIGIIFDYLQSTRYRKFCDYLPVGATVLDVGCGSGTFVEELIRLGYDCSGVELPGPAARRAAKIRGLKLYVGMLEDVTLPKKEFDFVVLWHVFEHLKDPRFAVNVIQGVLRENGTLVIALPNIQSLQSRIFKGYWFHIDPPIFL